MGNHSEAMMNDPLARFNEVSETVEIIQRKLRSVGFYRGPCHRRFDATLQAALGRYRAARGLPAGADCDMATWRRLDAEAGKTFYDVLRDELAALRPAPSPAPAADASPAPALSAPVTDAAHEAALAGLAFSGGGVRSATFNLGILQALAQTGMLRQFDYMSTVSGGGYIGGWLSRWIAAHETGLAGVEKALAEGGASPCEPPQVKFLRQYSNFLTPRVGMFSADTWALLATYFRNAFLNLLILTTGLAALLLLPRLWVYAATNVDARGMWNYMSVGLIGVSCFLFAVGRIAYGLTLVPDPAARATGGQGWVLWTIVLPLMVGAAAGSVFLWEYRDLIVKPWDDIGKSGFHPGALLSGLAQAFPWATEDQLVLMLLAPGFAYFLAWATGWGVAEWQNWRLRRHVPALRGQAPRHIFRQGLGHFLSAIGALAVGTLLVVASAVSIDDLDPPTNRQFLTHVASFGMPFMLSIFGIALVLMIGLIGRLYSDKSREWWSRQGGWTIILVLFWSGLFLFAVYSPVLVFWALLRAPGWASAFAAGWFGTAWASLWAARSPKTGAPDANRLLKWLALLGPPLISAAILTAVATAICLVLLQPPALTGSASFSDVLEAQMGASSLMDLPTLGLGFAACLAIFLLFALRVDVNKFSLYMMYRNRLVRTFLGAVNPNRTPHPFTGFDNQDDIALHKVARKDGRLQRPYHIINTALNLVKGRELAWQTRKAANFTFTPRYCGFETPRMPVSATAQAAADAERGLYRPTAQYGMRTTDTEETEKGVKLGMAMAISGAAASPNMGFHSSPSLTFLMTLFNVRLGRWCGNPAVRDAWRRAKPRSGFLYLIKELLGFTNASSNFLYLSDGGHFENLGIYELVRRRCRLVVAIDASADGELRFGDLGNAVRKCYTDLNIEIDLDVKKIERGDNGASSAYCVAGKIRYSAEHPGAPDGTLLYIKPSLLGNEFVDIYNYHQTNKTFPHQGTMDQWFDETQFESYRALGHHVGRTVFATLAHDLRGLPLNIERICAAIERYWLAEARHVQGNPIRFGAKLGNHNRVRNAR
jgi:uncharacterized membrane protein